MWTLSEESKVRKVRSTLVNLWLTAPQERISKAIDVSRIAIH